MFKYERNVYVTFAMGKGTNELDDKAHEWVKRTLRSEMVKRGFTYGKLAEELVHLGIVEEEVTLRNRVSRGAFSAAFFCQCLAAMGCKSLDIDLVSVLYDPNRSKWPSQIRAEVEEHAQWNRKPGKES